MKNSRQQNWTWAVALFLVAVSSSTGVIGQSSAKTRIPIAIEECEKRGRTQMCLTWKWNGKGFDGRWPDGSVGQMTEPHFIADHVVISREDQTGTSAGLSATYNGDLNNGTIQNGTVVWVFHGKATLGTWTAAFVYEPDDAPTR